MPSLIEAWEQLDSPWQTAFDLAWEGFWAGSPPIGAVVTDPDGHVVSSGRSRQFEVAAPSGQLAGTNLAHAEINALVQLARGDYSGHVLFTTLEPCLLCTSAITHSHVGTVRYAAADPLWTGIRRLPELNPHVKRRWPAWVGPMDTPLALLSNALVVIWHLEHRPGHALVDAHAGDGSAILEVARAISPLMHDLKGSRLAGAVRTLSKHITHSANSQR